MARDKASSIKPATRRPRIPRNLANFRGRPDGSRSRPVHDGGRFIATGSARPPRKLHLQAIGRSVGQARDPGNGGGGVDRRSPAESPERRCRGNDRAAIANSSVNIPSGRYLTVAADGVAFRFETLPGRE